MNKYINKLKKGLKMIIKYKKIEIKISLKEIVEIITLLLLLIQQYFH